MRISNSWTTGMPIYASNADFVTSCHPSALSNLRLKLLDCNMNPVRLLSPIFVTITVQDQEFKERQQSELEEFVMLAKGFSNKYYENMVKEEARIRQNTNQRHMNTLYNTPNILERPLMEIRNKDDFHPNVI